MVLFFLRGCGLAFRLIVPFAFTGTNPNPRFVPDRVRQPAQQWGRLRLAPQNTLHPSGFPTIWLSIARFLLSRAEKSPLYSSRLCLQSGHAAFALLVEKLAMPRPGNEKGMLGGTEVSVLVLPVFRTVCGGAWVCGC